MFDAGHTHGPTPYFVTDCPLCDASKTARNQAIGHLHEALYLLSKVNPSAEQPTVRLNLGPIGITGDDIQRCHSIDLTAKQAEALADSVDSMNSYLGSESAIDQDLRDLASAIEAAIPNDDASVARRHAELMARVEGQAGEAIESGEWSAAAVAQHNTDTWDEVNDVFAELDLVALTRDVLNEPGASKLAVTLALDSFLGDVPDAHADEDGDA